MIKPGDYVKVLKNSSNAFRSGLDRLLRKNDIVLVKKVAKVPLGGKNPLCCIYECRNRSMVYFNNQNEPIVSTDSYFLQLSDVQELKNKFIPIEAIQYVVNCDSFVRSKL